MGAWGHCSSQRSLQVHFLSNVGSSNSHLWLPVEDVLEMYMGNWFIVYLLISLTGMEGMLPPADSLPFNTCNLPRLSQTEARSLECNLDSSCKGQGSWFLVVHPSVCMRSKQSQKPELSTGTQGGGLLTHWATQPPQGFKSEERCLSPDQTVGPCCSHPCLDSSLSPVAVSSWKHGKGCVTGTTSQLTPCFLLAHLP